MKQLARIVLVLATLGGCSDGDRDATRRELPRDPPRERRVIEPPVGIVRALPPHAIRADGVGPFRLGERLSAMLEQLPSGPRIALFEIPGLLHRSVIRTEDATVLIGGEPGGLATSVAVVDPDVARTESGIHVGSTKADVERVLGPLVSSLTSARDPRLAIPTSLPNARLILQDDRVAAIVITSGPDSQPAPVRAATSEPGCARPAATDRAIGTCLTGAGELVLVEDTQITIRASGGERRVLTSFRAPAPIVFVAPLRVSEHRDELAIVTTTEKDQVRIWSLVVYRFDGGRLRPSVDPSPLYQLSSTNARWIGAELGDIELYLELAIGSDGVEVGGLLTTRTEDGKRVRDAVVITPVSVARRTGRTAPPEPATVIDAGMADAPDAPASAPRQD